MKKLKGGTCHSEHKYSHLHRKYTPSYPANNRALCGDDCEIEEEEEICNEETFDASQIRYGLDCGSVSKLRSVGIEKGSRLDYILEDLYTKVKNIEYVETPKVPNKPLLTTFQAIISDLYGLIENQKIEIQKLKDKLNE